MNDKIKVFTKLFNTVKPSYEEAWDEKKQLEEEERQIQQKIQEEKQKILDAERKAKM